MSESTAEVPGPPSIVAPPNPPSEAVEDHGVEAIHPEPSTSSGISAASLALSAVIGLIGGGVGAWAYDAFLADRLHPDNPPPRAAGNLADAQPSPGSAEKLAERVENLDERIKSLGAQLAKIPVNPPTPDLTPLQTSLDEVNRLKERVEELARQFEEIPDQLKQNEQSIASNAQNLEEMRTRLTTLRSDVEPADTAGSTPADEATSVESLLARGSSLFHDRKYGEARREFEDLTSSHPDDARGWYFAALANGLDTGNWQGETERLVKKGIERERAGTPSASDIDAAFVDLTPKTGKDWLAAYRKRAR